MDTQFHQKELSNLELAEFCNQMGIVLHSGISSLEGLMLLAEDSQSEDEKLLLEKMIEKMEATGFFHDAVSSTGVFPPYALHMIKLGEETGCLDEIMTSLSRHYTREANFAQMIKSALIYPCIMLGMMALVIIVLLTKVLPVFQQVFRQLGQEMTGFSAGLLNAGEVLSRNAIVFIILLAACILFILFGHKHFPFQKKTNDMIAACRFCEGMAIALKSGITPEEGLTLTANLIENDEYTSKITECKTQLEEGASLANALHKSQLLTGTYARMASLADKTGTLDETLSYIASEYEYSVNNRITSIISMLEPTLVIILSVIVGIILFSVMLPLLGIMSGL